METNIFLQQVVNGIISGSIYVLLGLGLSQIYGILEISHFAHGSVMMVGGYVAYTVSQLLGLPLWLGVIIAVLFCIMLGIFMERFGYRVIIKGPPINIFILALGFMYIIENLVLMIWGPDPVAVLAPSNITLKLGPITVTSFRLIVFFVNIAILVALSALIKFTKLGRAIRALAQNREAAAMVGVNINRTSSTVFGIGSALAGLCGFFISAMISIAPHYGGEVVLKGFAVMILGGLGSIPGVILGGMIMGVVESLGSWLISTAYKDAFGFIIIMIVLIFKPTGLLGKKAAR